MKNIWKNKRIFVIYSATRYSVLSTQWVSPNAKRNVRKVIFIYIIIYINIEFSLHKHRLNGTHWILSTEYLRGVKKESSSRFHPMFFMFQKIDFMIENILKKYPKILDFRFLILYLCSVNQLTVDTSPATRNYQPKTWYATSLQQTQTHF